MAAKRPQPPKSLGAPGKKLWRAILRDLADDWQLDARELALLERAGRCADEIAQLEKAIDRDGIMVDGSKGQTRTHPAVGEARQLRLVLLRLLGSIELVDPTARKRSATPAQARARHAAEVRWGLEEARNG